jgi:hypothetical protein
MSDAPPPAIEHRLAALVPRLRALRVARGAARFVVAVLAAACAVLLLDAAFPLPAWVRGLFLSVWLTAAGVLAWRWILIPWRAEIPLAEVALELEQVLPELGERLCAVVSPPPPGQPEALRTALVADTARRTKSIDLLQALPVKPVAWFVAGAAGAVLAVAATAALVPGSGDRIRRVALPWHRPPQPGFRIVVTSGDAVVKRGDQVWLSAYAERTGAAPPTEAVVVFRDGPGAPEVREPMTFDGGAFHFRWPSAITDFEYRVEIGTAQSDWFRVTALDPVELADGTRIEIVPPEYATTQKKRTLTALTDLDGLEYSTLHFHLKFTRPAEAVHFLWRARDLPKDEVIAVELAPDRLSATAHFPLRSSGVLTLVLKRAANGKWLETPTPVNVRATRDEPPWFEQVSGVAPRLRTVRPGAEVPIAFVARDDMSVAGAALVYVVGPDESKSTTVPITLTGSGTPRATGQIPLALAGKANEGDTVRFRITLSDNRRVGADPALGPQGAVYPPSGWSELKLTATAPPLEQQDIICQRDALHEPLEHGAKELEEAADKVAALRNSTAGGFALTVDQSAQLHAVKEQVGGAEDALLAAARDAALTPELRPLAADVRAVGEQKLRAAQDALRRAEVDNASRTDAFNTAITHLRDGHARLNELIARNAKFARERLDRTKLTALASEQTALADGAKAAPPDLLPRQKALLARLEALIAESDALKAAVGSTRVEEVRRLAGVISELATKLRELDAAARESADEIRSALAGGIARDQDALEKRVTSVFAELDTAARLAGVALPRPEDFRRIADLAAAAKTVEALAELEKHSQAVTQIAATFDKWAAERIDPRSAAKQLALWQTDLQARAGAATKDTTYEKLSVDLKKMFHTEQQAIHSAAEALALPPELAKARESALIHTGRARDSLATNGAGALDAMKFASDALLRLAAQTPTIGERHAKALRALDPLRQELDSSGNAVDQVLRNSERQPPDALARKLAPLAERQRKLIAGALALDLPGLSERHARVLSALAAAVGDMQDGSQLDIQTSQAWVRREFERLKLVLEGNPAADARADELFHRLAALAASLDAQGVLLTKQHLEPVVPVLQDAWRQFGLMVVPEAPVLVNDARNAVQAAEIAIRDAKPDEARRRVRSAVEALGKLADRLNGFESDLERINRLAASRRLAAEKPKELLFSDEAQRQLGRESDELGATRVGFAGQALKKRALDLYAKLRAKTDPERIGTDQKVLATTLDELAAKMADIAELAVAGERATPLSVTGADRFLPSKPHAEALRDLAKRQRLLHAQVTSFTTELASRLRPSVGNPLAALDAKQRQLALDALALVRETALDSALKASDAALRAADRVRVGQVLAAKEAGARAAAAFRQLSAAGADKPWGKRAAELAGRQDEIIDGLSELLTQPNVISAQQVARTEELGHDSGELAGAIERAALVFAPGDPTGQVLLGAGKLAREAEKRLLEAAKKATEGGTADAEKLRAAAEMTLRDAANLVARAAPPAPPEGVNVAVGDNVQTAKRAMRKAIDALAPGGNPTAAPGAMREAAHALAEAAKKAGE